MAISQRPQSPVIPQPLHNKDGTLRALARQYLHDLDESSLTTVLPTATVKLLLEALVEALDRPARQQPAIAANEGLVETTSNPNLRLWVQRTAQDFDDTDEDGVPRPLRPLGG